MLNETPKFDVYIDDYTREVLANKKKYPSGDGHYVSKWKKLSQLCFMAASLLLVVLVIFLIINKQYVIDQVRVWNYTPTEETKSLANGSGLNDYGIFLFYSGHPILESSSNFNNMCDRVEKITSVLGCYKNHNIYLYDIKNEQLEGIREVTATHETLHVAYDRLSEIEKDRVDALLENEYTKLENNENFKYKMAFYARTEPGQRGNELHSVIGTEVGSISPELETHFLKYFYDRQKIVALNTKYISIFQDLENQTNALELELNTLGKDISDRSNEYDQKIKNLNKDIEQFNVKTRSGMFTTPSQFNIEREMLVARVDDLDASKNSIYSDSKHYNELIEELNLISFKSQNLYNSIDSTLAPAPTL